MHPTAIFSYPLASDKILAGDTPSIPPSSPLAPPSSSTPPSAGKAGTAERRDPTFLPSCSPQSRRELVIGRSTPRHSFAKEECLLGIR